jgi:hypothetical protein
MGLEIISQYLGAGLSVIPVKSDKRPLIDWKPFQGAIATPEQSEGWKLPIAAVCGAVSGGLVCIDFDDKGSQFEAWGVRVNELCAGLTDNLVIQRTPSGGWHVVFRTVAKIENTKLASREAKEGEDGKVRVLIETRGEGGYFLIAPSAGYVLRRGDFCKIPVLSEEHAELLLEVSRSFNQIAKEKEPAKSSVSLNSAGITPFDDFDARTTDPIYLLENKGWREVGRSGDKVLLCRPGKNNGISATWNHIPGRLYVFSTSTEFESQHLYKPSAIYAILEHRGDYVAAVKQLYHDGYGQRKELKKPVDIDTSAKTRTVKISEFKSRIFEFYKTPKAKGLCLGLEKFDKIIRFDRGYLNVVTGIPSHGKSEFLDFILVLLAKKHGWNICVFSPENYPLEIHFNKLAEKYHNCSMWGAGQEFIAEAIDFVDDHFDFIDATEDELNLESIMNACLDAKAKGKIDALVIDPWNEIEQFRDKDMSETDFTGVCLRRLRKFARKNNICLFVIVHPTKMYRKPGQATYPVPTLYDISGSANWYNKSDNGIVVYRNFDNGIIDVYVKKVKFRSYGEIGKVEFQYVKSSGNFKEVTDAESFDAVPEVEQTELAIANHE